MLQTHRCELVSAPAGARWSILGIVLENGQRPIEQYLERPGADADGFIASINILLKAEPFQQMGKRFKRLRNVANVFQITTHHDRYLGFRCRQDLILTNAFRKDAAETPPDGIAACVALQRAYFMQHGG